jgi:hypothetical protein
MSARALIDQAYGEWVLRVSVSIDTIIYSDNSTVMIVAGDCFEVPLFLWAFRSSSLSSTSMHSAGDRRDSQLRAVQSYATASA